MSQFSTKDVVNVFKNVYGKMTDLQPDGKGLGADIPFSSKQKVGEKYIEAVVLTAETGITLGGSGADAFELNPAIAGTVKQTEVTPYTNVLASVIPWGVISRSVGSEQAFFSATKHVVKNNLKSHAKFNEDFRLYGQSDDLLGYVSYATATYRGVAFTNGTGALDVNGASVSFTNGVSTADKAILLAPGQFASGIWVGREGVIVQQIDASGVVVGEGKLVQVDSEQGALIVDFTPVAATSATSHRLCFKGMAEAKEMIGAKKILTTSGSLFGIPTNQYALWKGSSLALSNVRLTYERVQKAIANAVNRGGLDGEVTAYVNPRTWETLVTDQAAARDYDSSYKPSQAENGFEAIRFHSQNGGIVIKAHRCVKEGDAFIMHLGDWSRSGSAEVGFSIPGMDGQGDVIFALQNQAGYAFRTYSDQYLFCHAPARSIMVTGINDESAT